MKYEKPELQLIAFSPDKTIAAGGLALWLEQNSFASDTENHISSYLVNS